MFLLAHDAPFTCLYSLALRYLQARPLPVGIFLSIFLVLPTVIPYSIHAGGSRVRSQDQVHMPAAWQMPLETLQASSPQPLRNYFSFLLSPLASEGLLKAPFYLEALYS